MIEITARYLLAQGLSRSFPDRFWSKVERCGDFDCWLWMAGKTIFGYGQIGRGWPFRGNIGAHVAAYILTTGPIPKGLCVLHSCPITPVPACVNPWHLKLGTKQDNADDREMAGRGIYGRTRGESVCAHKLSGKDVLNLRKLHFQHGLSYAELGRLFGISDVAARKIVLGLSWSHIKPVGA